MGDATFPDQMSPVPAFRIRGTGLDIGDARMDRLLRLRRLCILRGDRLALIIIEARMRALFGESVLRSLWGDR